MKHHLFIASTIILSFLLSGCYDDSGINKRIDEIDARLIEVEALVRQMNFNIGALQVAVEAVSSQDQVTGVVPLTDGSGYQITFSQSGTIIIYHGTDGLNGTNGENGKDGSNPKIGLQEVGGINYWTVNGEFLLDPDGNKIPVYIKPLIRINEGRFEISYDGGTTWEDIGDAGSASTGPSGIIFSDVEDRDDAVVLTLADGRIITIPKATAFMLNVDNTQLIILPGGMAMLNYTVNASDDQTVVDYFATGGFSVQLMSESQSRGMMLITAPDPLTDGKIYFFAVNGKGQTSMRIITFEAGELKIVLLSTSPVPAEGGTVEIQVTTNLEYDIYIQDSWVHYVETKAKRTETVSFAVDANPNSEPRSTTIQLVDLEEGDEIESLTLYQDANTSSSPSGSYTNTIEDWEKTGTVVF